MTDDPQGAIRVKCPPSHAYSLALASGLMAAADLLDKLPSSAKSTPGVALARSAILAEAHEVRASVIAKNLAIIARAGHNVGLHKSIGFDPNKNELICEFYEPDLFDSETQD